MCGVHSIPSFLVLIIFIRSVEPELKVPLQFPESSTIGVSVWQFHSFLVESINERMIHHSSDIRSHCGSIEWSEKCFRLIQFRSELQQPIYGQRLLSRILQSRKCTPYLHRKAKRNLVHCFWFDCSWTWKIQNPKHWERDEVWLHEWIFTRFSNENWKRTFQAPAICVANKNRYFYFVFFCCHLIRLEPGTVVTIVCCEPSVKQPTLRSEWTMAF